MAVVKKNLPNHKWGTLPVTFGMTVKSCNQKADMDIFEHRDENNEVTGEVEHNFKIEGTIVGVTTKTPDLILGDAITLPDEIAALGGVTGGTTRIRSIDVADDQGNLREMTIAFIRRPTMTIA